MENRLTQLEHKFDLLKESMHRIELTMARSVVAKLIQWILLLYAAVAVEMLVVIARGFH